MKFVEIFQKKCTNMSTEIKNKNITELDLTELLNAFSHDDTSIQNIMSVKLNTCTDSNMYNFKGGTFSETRPSAFYKDGRKLKREEYIDTHHIDVEFQSYFPECGCINLYKIASRSLNDECEYKDSYDCNVLYPCEKCTNNLRQFVPTLNRMISIDTPKWGRDNKKEKLHLAETEQRNLTFDDYVLHTTRVRMFLDPDEFDIPDLYSQETSSTQFRRSGHEREKYYVCGIPVNEIGMAYGNFCSFIALDKATNTYYIDGEAG